MFQKTIVVDEIDKNRLFSTENGYGYVTEENRAKDELLQFPEITSGFIPVKMVTVRPIPTIFRMEVEKQGNYHVNITVENDGSEAILFMERRRLYYYGFFEGKKTISASVNVCDVIPRGKEEVYEDKYLDISWLGTGLKVVKIEVTSVECPTIYIAGDSTVTDQPADYPYSPGTSYSGWGQMLSGFLNDKVAVSNHSHSGLTTETFRNEGHYAIVEKYIKPGDYLFIQFGHNDQKLAHLKEDTGYRANLLRYIDECSNKGVHPVIVTSLARNTWINNGEAYNDLLKAYANECIRLGEELNIPVIDLHQYSMDLVIENGLEESKKFYHPGDLTHTNDYGAYIMAAYVADSMKKIGEASDNAYSKFADFVTQDTCEWKIDKELLKMPVLSTNEDQPEDEPYTLKMDRLEEIITNKN